jgi:RNA recognition motif-containing protein
MNLTVSVDNLPACCTEEHLCTLFAPYGPVQVLIATDRTGKHMGFAFIVCYSAPAAEQAIATLNGTDMMGHCIRVCSTISLAPHAHVA